MKKFRKSFAAKPLFLPPTLQLQLLIHNTLSLTFKLGPNHPNHGILQSPPHLACILTSISLQLILTQVIANGAKRCNWQNAPPHFHHNAVISWQAQPYHNTDISISLEATPHDTIATPPSFLTIYLSRLFTTSPSLMISHPDFSYKTISTMPPLNEPPYNTISSTLPSLLRSHHTPLSPQYCKLSQQAITHRCLHDLNKPLHTNTVVTMSPSPLTRSYCTPPPPWSCHLSQQAICHNAVSTMPSCFSTSHHTTLLWRSSEKTERWRFVWCNGLLALDFFKIDWEIEGARYVIFDKPILLTNQLGIHQSQNFLCEEWRERAKLYNSLGILSGTPPFPWPLGGVIHRTYTTGGVWGSSTMVVVYVVCSCHVLWSCLVVVTRHK